MIEAEAKTKWCPMARNVVAFDTGRGVERQVGGNAGARCIGSACMMWRELQPAYLPVSGGGVTLTTTSNPHLLAGHGYCGFGGKP